jgi:hypothetical protein
MKIAVLLLALALTGTANSDKPVEVPARFVADGVYVDLPLANGKLIHLYTDSGGGSVIVARSAAKRVGLKLHPITDPDLKAELGPGVSAAEKPALAEGLPQLPDRIFVVARAAQIPAWPEQGDGFLGAKWFEGGVWTWDYRRHKLWREGASWRSDDEAHEVPLGFKTLPNGSRPNNFARIEVKIDGRVVPMLLDTGAETLLSEHALEALADGGPALRATSMIEATIFDDLHAQHPDWRYVQDAQVTTKAAMLLVPGVEIAGFRTGPVWFTRRSDSAYQKFMSPMMDEPVVGSIGDR